MNLCYCLSMKNRYVQNAMVFYDEEQVSSQEQYFSVVLISHNAISVVKSIVTLREISKILLDNTYDFATLTRKLENTVKKRRRQ